MTFVEKLKRLTDETGRARVARAAGLPKTAITNYITKNQTPRADKALAIARALNVSIDWLFDDSQDFPAPESQEAPSLRDVSDEELMEEVARRYRQTGVALIKAMDRAMKVDWERAAAELAKVPEDAKEAPEYVTNAAGILRTIELNFNRYRQTFDPHFFGIVHHAELPGKELPVTEFDDVVFDYHEWSLREEVAKFGVLVRARPWLLDKADWERLARHRAESHTFFDVRLDPSSRNHQAAMRAAKNAEQQQGQNRPKSQRKTDGDAE